MPFAGRLRRLCRTYRMYRMYHIYAVPKLRTQLGPAKRKCTNMHEGSNSPGMMRGRGLYKLVLSLERMCNELRGGWAPIAYGTGV